MSSRVLQLLLAAGAISVIVAAGAAAGPLAPTTVTVHRIVDGDTLVVRGGARIRLVQLDAPESGEECYARASTLELATLARPGARVVLEADPLLDRVDRYGRLLRYVHAGGRNVNLELVRRGAATPWFLRRRSRSLRAGTARCRRVGESETPRDVGYLPRAVVTGGTGLHSIGVRRHSDE